MTQETQAMSGDTLITIGSDVTSIQEARDRGALKSPSNGTEERPQLTKRLLCSPYKRVGIMVCSCNPSLGLTGLNQ